MRSSLIIIAALVQHVFTASVVQEDTIPRFIAYVNCIAGAPVVTQWEQQGVSPFTHYVVSFLSFDLNQNLIQTDPGNIWADNGGSTTNFQLEASLATMLRAAVAGGKHVMLSLGGEVGSNGFLQWRRALSIAQMRAQIENVVNLFESQNDVRVAGIDVDIELGGWYDYGQEKYDSTRDLINAIPDRFLACFVPQVGNGLCAAPTVADLNGGLTPIDTLAGQCQHSEITGGTPGWVLERLDDDCLRADGSPKLNWWGIQYYNAGQAACCGGGGSYDQQALSTFQHYKNFANGWPSSGNISDPANPFHQWQYFPGPFSAFDGVKASRLVLGKPSCNGCAGSNYMPQETLINVLRNLKGKLHDRFGGILFWDLCRIFSDTGSLCVGGVCPPSWGGETPDVSNALQRLTAIKNEMDLLK